MSQFAAEFLHDQMAHTSFAEWTEGVCGDGAAILRDGHPVQISELLDLLNTMERVRADREATTRFSFDVEFYIQGIRMNPGDYILTRTGPPTIDDQPF